MEFWMNNALRMQGNNGCEVLHLFLQRLRLLPLRCSVFKNLANTGHRQLCGPATVSLLKIPSIIIPPLSLPPHLAERNILHCFHSPWFLTLLMVLVVFDVI